MSAIFTLLYSANVCAHECRSDINSNLTSLQNFVSAVKNACLSKKIELDSSLIQPWRPDATLPCTGTFVASFQHGGKELHFLAVNHLSGETRLDSPELAFIKGVIQRAKPRSVLVEVASNGSPQLAKDALKSMESSCLKGEKFSCSEGMYAAFFANRIESKVVAGEPSPSALFPALLKKHTLNDLYAFSSVRALVTLQRSGVPIDQWPSAMMNEVRKEITEANGPWSYESFQNWWKKNIGQDLNPSKITSGLLEPRNDPGANKVQEIANSSDVVRESILLKQTQDLLNLDSPTVVVYGTSHFLKQQKALEGSLGLPKITCLKQ